MIERRYLEDKERFLAPYAKKSKDSKGRVYKEKEHGYRTCYQRDRDRIIYSTAFRRLEYKTQVFVNHEGDYYRTRLTHTLEVAQIAKTIARALGLNEDLVESIALAHDLGHTPFGHSGEDALREIMESKGGFDHNTQGLRVVDILEERYPDFPGLNLTYETREGIVRHSSMFGPSTPPLDFAPSGVEGRSREIDNPPVNDKFSEGASPILEIQVVDIADEIAYDNHDLDDGITSGLIKEDDLKGLELWVGKNRELRKKYRSMKGEILKYQVIRSLINDQVTDLIETTEYNIKRLKIRTPDNACWIPDRMVSFSEKMCDLRSPLRQFLSKNLYDHYRVVRMSNKAHRFMTSLFNIYIDKPEQLPPTTHRRLETEDAHRVICDYIAGMTDRYALDEYKKFFEPYERV